MKGTYMKITARFLQKPCFNLNYNHLISYKKSRNITFCHNVYLIFYVWFVSYVLSVGLPLNTASQLLNILQPIGFVFALIKFTFNNGTFFRIFKIIIIPLIYRKQDSHIFGRLNFLYLIYVRRYSF